MTSDRVSLDDFVRLKRGYDLPETSRRVGDIPVLGSFGVTGRHDTPKHSGPGVTIGRSGASIGVATYCEGPYWPLNTALYVQDFKGNDPRFVYFVLDAIDFRSHNSGAAQPSLNRNYLGSIEVWRPDLDVQRTVAHALGSIDDLIANNLRRIECLEQTASLVFREWFVQFRCPRVSTEALAASELGEIPQGWTITSLEEHARLRREGIMPRDAAAELFDHYSIPAFDAARLPSVELGGDIKSGKYVLRQPCVLLSKLNPRLPRVWRVDPSSSKSRAICSTEFLVLETEADWPLPFVYSVVNDRDFGSRMAAMAGGTSTSHQRANPNDVMALPIIGPPAALISDFAELITPVLSMADSLVVQSDILRRVRARLLPRLVSGDLDIFTLDVDAVAVA